MTDTFVQNAGDQSAPQGQNDLPSGDQQQAGGEGNVDTHNPEYQIQVMQKRLADKDEFIKTLESENQKTREMYASLAERATNLDQINEVLDRSEQDVNSQDTSLDEDALVGKVIDNLNKKQTEQKMQQNYETVLQRLNNEFGEQHIEAKVQEAAQTNGLSVSDMLETARKSPQAFYKLVGLEGQRQVRTPTPTHSSVTTPTETGEKDFAYYSRLMRDNPREYFKPETQREFRKLFQQQD